MIPKELYCPECGELWDMEECDNCGHSDESLLKKKVVVKKRQKDGAETKEEYRG